VVSAEKRYAVGAHLILDPGYKVKSVRQKCGVDFTLKTCILYLRFLMVDRQCKGILQKIKILQTANDKYFVSLSCQLPRDNLFLEFINICIVRSWIMYQANLSWVIYYLLLIFWELYGSPTLNRPLGVIR
jgi:hypothetical protein